MKDDFQFPSLIEAINASVLSRDAVSALSTDQRITQHEIRKRYPLTAGIVIPWFSNERRGLATSSVADGGYLVGSTVLELAPALSNALVLERLGCRVLGGLQSDTAIPYGKARMLAEWLSETEQNNPANEQIGCLLLSPSRVSATILASSQLIRQSPAAEPFLRSELMGALAEAIQDVAIDGNGFDKQPIGILNTSGIGVLAGDTNGSAPTYDDVCALEEMVADSNAEDGSIGWLVSPKGRKKLRKTPMFSGGSSPIWNNRDASSLLGRAAGVTKSVPDDLNKGSASNCSAIIAGKFSELFVGIFGAGVDITVNPYTFADRGMIEITGCCSVDTGVLRPNAFAAKKDALCSL